VQLTFFLLVSILSFLDICIVGLLHEIFLAIVKHKVRRFKQICGTIIRTLTGKVRKVTLLTFYKIMAILSLLRGSECWTLTVQQKGRLEAADLRLLRAMS
jgi:hypothetical protein